jgi:hypothetical protein
MVVMQTDDTLSVGDDKFQAQEETELRKADFKAKEKRVLTVINPIDFNGGILTLTPDEADTLLMRQKGQGKKLNLVGNSQEYVEQRARGSYIASICQPEATFDMSAAAQHQTEPTKEEIARLNKRIQWQISNIERGLRFIPIDLPTAKPFVFVDGSFANNKDLSSQIGYEIFIANEKATEGSFTMTGNIIHWSSTKCKRVTRSVLASEIYAMTSGVDMGIAVNTTMGMIMAKLNLPSIPLVVCTDSFSLYECLVKLGTTKEKRLMIDIMALRQSYERRELFEVRWINGNDNPADSMTKSNANRALQHFVDENEITVRVQGSVERYRQY